MSTTSPDALFDDVPLSRIPVETKICGAIAEEYGLERSRLVGTLEAIQEDLSDRAVDIHGRYTAEWGDNAIIMDTVIWEAIYVYSDEWDELRERLDLEEELFEAAMAYHGHLVDRLIQTVEAAEAAAYLQTNAVLVMPTPMVGNLLRAGLSRRQAMVQALRLEGDSQSRIAAKLDNATGTIKSHCDRIDRKIEEARHLVDLVDSHDST